jgi:RNA polymerase sigma-70 factor, ECF subfamily
VALPDYVDGLFVYAMTLTRNSFEAEDLVHETFVRALPAMERLRENSNLRAWLYGILRNIWLDQVRQQRATPKFFELDADKNSADLFIETANDPHAVYVTKYETRQVRQALRQLPEEFREIIVLREFADLSYQEIASWLDCPPGTVMSRLSRARSKLGTLLSSTNKFWNTKKSSQGAETRECFELGC